MDSKSSYSLTEIRDAMRARVPQGVGTGNPYKFARRRKSLADYCDFIIGGIEPYSSPDVRIKKVLDESV